jgi:predicted  nucleic acid-binding Zn-ribbon protein
MSVYHDTLITEVQQLREDYERKLFRSKLETLNHTLENLIQKKIRIDLEIRRTKKKISKLKTSSQTLVKTRVELEGFNYDAFSEIDSIDLRSKISEEMFQELFELDRQVFIASNLIKEVDSLPLFNE